MFVCFYADPDGIVLKKVSSHFVWRHPLLLGDTMLLLFSIVLYCVIQCTTQYYIVIYLNGKFFLKLN